MNNDFKSSHLWESCHFTDWLFSVYKEWLLSCSVALFMCMYGTGMIEKPINYLGSAGSSIDLNKGC